ncbi:MAG: sugar-binding transcriptional regulator [Treponema sp.]|jgi:DNA-binding transcriptional regulator LsrR (DeoR family)|nr:sugar-binding transcriptional regulator [Treponema sp.]
MDFEEELMAKAAWYYYQKDMTQQKISELLGISRMRVIRLLDKSKETGLVQFKIREGNARRIQIEEQLKDRYRLQDCFIIPTPVEADIGTVNDAIADAAAMYLSSRLQSNAFVNIGYGDTTGKTLNNLAKITENPISFISLTGGVSIYLPNARSNVFNARLFLIPAPMVVSSKEMKAAIREEKSVIEITRMVSLASFTIIGIGGMNDEATILKTGSLTSADFLHLKMQDAVGDILCHFIDRQGRVIPTPFEDRLVSTPLDVLKSLPNVIGVAAGRNKQEAIRGALTLGLIDILITNEETAEHLC